MVQLLTLKGFTLPLGKLASFEDLPMANLASKLILPMVYLALLQMNWIFFFNIIEEVNCMDRIAMAKLELWASSSNRKPLIIQGARQVGKTWLIQEFGRTHFHQTAYISFMDDENMRAVFEGSLDCHRLLQAISLATNTDAGNSDVLVVFDEIQECPRALMSLKMFCETRPDVPIVAAGSPLGVAMHQDISYPVGKVDYLDLFPLTFSEFLRGTGDAKLADVVDAADFDMMTAFSEMLTDKLRFYYFVGGMPEAVTAFGREANFDAARTVQERLLRDYEQDFSKHTSPEMAEKIRLVWQSAPGQLTRENKKFIYSAVRTGARARSYEEAIQWLVDAGLLIRVRRIKKPTLPLAGYEDKDAFKLYLLDVGLLGAASNLDKSTIVKQNHLFTEFKGSLTENFACQSLQTNGIKNLHYWSSKNSSAEIDFIYDYAGEIVPVEVKAEENLRSKSLHSFIDSYHLKRGLRLSLRGYREQDWLINVPLYAVGTVPQKIADRL